MMSDAELGGHRDKKSIQVHAILINGTVVSTQSVVPECVNRLTMGSEAKVLARGYDDGIGIRDLFVQVDRIMEGNSIPIGDADVLRQPKRR